MKHCSIALEIVELRAASVTYAFFQLSARLFITYLYLPYFLLLYSEESIKTMEKPRYYSMQPAFTRDK